MGMRTSYHRSLFGLFRDHGLAALVLCACWLACTCCGAQDGVFEILRGNTVVGRIVVDREVKGGATSYSMVSAAMFDLVWKQHVRTSVTTQYVDGRVTGCKSSVHLNHALRDSSHLNSVGSKALYFVHPSEVYMAAPPTNEWTTARMYYEEPTGQDSIFVESALRDCPLERLAVGEYRLTLPNKSRNHYVYRNGTLHEIRVDRGWFDLVFRRVI